MYVILNYQNNNYSILDTKDMVTESIDFNTLQILAKKNIKVLGFYNINNNIQSKYLSLNNFIKNQLPLVLVMVDNDKGNLFKLSDGRQIKVKIANNKVVSEIVNNDNKFLISNLLFNKDIEKVNIPTACRHECYLFSKSTREHILYIPDEVTELYDNVNDRRSLTKYICKLEGKLKVIGGKNLKDATGMFEGCQAKSLDLSNFDTSKVIDMFRMFYRCQAKFLDLSNFDISKGRYVDMFDSCQAEIKTNDAKLLKAYKERRI